MGGAEAQEASEQTKKKGGKLPVILALLLLFGGGGFFYMKVKAKGTPAKVEIMLGEVVPLKEFLVNLQSPSTYARTEIALHLKDGYKKEELDKSMSAVLEAVQMVLSSKSSSEVGTVEGKLALKRELASKINAVLEEAAQASGHGAADAEKEKPGDSTSRTADEGDKKLEHPTWDSDTGPVLRVYLTSFATQ